MNKDLKGISLVLAGVVLAMGSVGGAELNMNLISYQGLQLLAAAVVGMAAMILGTSLLTELE